MRWLVAGLSYVNVAAVSALLLGMVSSGLNRVIAVVSLLLGFCAAVAAWMFTVDDEPPRVAPVPNTEQKPRHGSKRHRKDVAIARRSIAERYGGVWKWLVFAAFAVFAVRSFCWLYYIDGTEMKIQSPNNLGDLSLHLTYIKHFASGAPLWPDNPIFVIGKLRYPGGIDLFNGLLACADVTIVRGLVWVGLLGSLATCYALYRWGGTFGTAGFLFNGGLAGFQVLQSFNFLDYQGDKTIAWKSLPLAMLVTQRGLLYALPAGLALLYHWRAKYRASREGSDTRGIMPLWLELTLYATMPLFHVHTFLSLSVVLAFFFIFGNAESRKQTAFLVVLALLPATFFMWTVSDHFHAGSILQWKPGWVQDNGDFKMPFFQFWLVNFGAWVPLTAGLLIVYATRIRDRWRGGERGWPESVSMLAAAALLFLLTVLVKTAPWEWDNTKILIWAYLLVLPLLWMELVKSWPVSARAVACIALFGSGFVTLIGGLGAGRTGYGMIDRAELDGVGVGVRSLPPSARFVSHPTYNHPVLLQGRPAVMGYPGHLWTQGFNYSTVEPKLTALLQGSANWKQLATELHAQYLFWGREEKAHYPQSARPWERELKPVATGTWGSIYDLRSLNAAPR